MTNPVSKFRSNIFGSRGCDIQNALDYAETMINTLSATDQVAVRTALGVVLNTIDNAVTQALGPSPEKLAIIALIDERIAEHKLVREEDLQSKVMELLEHDDISDQISDWMSNNFDIDDYDLDSQIENWVDNNLDEKVAEAVNNLTFKVTLE